MRVLVLSARMPLATGKGDQVRSFRYLTALVEEHEVTVVTTGAGQRDEAGEAELRRLARVVLVEPGRLRRVLGAAGALLRGVPGQVGWMMPPVAWRAALAESRKADVVLAMTARSLRGAVPAPLVLDHVDALSLNMRRRVSGSEPAYVRAGAALEARLLRRWEHRLAPLVAGGLVTSPEDARALPARPRLVVLPVAIPLALHPVAPATERTIDVILTGNMSYPPNADAAAWLSADLAPRIWARRPQTRIVVVGRDAGGLRLDPRLDVHADVPDVTAFLQDAKVAVAPLRIGTGSPYKVLEALAAGAPVVGTPAAVRPFGLGPDVALSAEDPQALADAVVDLLDDEGRREAMRRAAHAVLAAFTPAGQGKVVERLMQHAVSPGEPARV